MLIQSIELIGELNHVTSGVVLIGHNRFSTWGQAEVGPAPSHKVSGGATRDYIGLACMQMHMYRARALTKHIFRSDASVTVTLLSGPLCHQCVVGIPHDVQNHLQEFGSAGLDPGAWDLNPLPPPPHHVSN